MAFGFPAYHQEDFMIPATLPPAVLWQALQAMGWNGYGTPDGLQFRVQSALSFGSWGENITVLRVAPDRIQVRSECVLPTQVFDWGRNEQNVKRFFATLVAIAQGQPPPRF
jgi:DNA segregation ATPase FtsK/SpoIIIE-like protein